MLANSAHDDKIYTCGGDDDTYSDSGVAASFEGLNVVGGHVEPCSVGIVGCPVRASRRSSLHWTEAEKNDEIHFLPTRKYLLIGFSVIIPTAISYGRTL